MKQHVTYWQRLSIIIRSIVLFVMIGYTYSTQADVNVTPSMFSRSGIAVYPSITIKQGMIKNNVTEVYNANRLIIAGLPLSFKIKLKEGFYIQSIYIYNEKGDFKAALSGNRMRKSRFLDDDIDGFLFFDFKRYGLKSVIKMVLFKPILDSGQRLQMLDNSYVTELIRPEDNPIVSITSLENCENKQNRFIKDIKVISPEINKDLFITNAECPVHVKNNKGDIFILAQCNIKHLYATYDDKCHILDGFNLLLAVSRNKGKSFEYKVIPRTVFGNYNHSNVSCVFCEATRELMIFLGDGYITTSDYGMTFSPFHWLKFRTDDVTINK